ncbi:MAG: ParB N-terminal domain-containing protein [Desulfobacterales bacterium]|nr:ParB N-terminal domain-containing protein [Desulfobacterales bacterium]
MKHDGHFVDLISARSLGPRIRMIPIDKIDPNPHQARCELGNIEELQDSIRSKGILEPILVRAKRQPFRDHRRRAAFPGLARTSASRSCRASTWRSRTTRPWRSP